MTTPRHDPRVQAAIADLLTSFKVSSPYHPGALVAVSSLTSLRKLPPRGLWQPKLKAIGLTIRKDTRQRDISHSDIIVNRLGRLLEKHDLADVGTTRIRRGGHHTDLDAAWIELQRTSSVGSTALRQECLTILCTPGREREVSAATATLLRLNGLLRPGALSVLAWPPRLGRVDDAVVLLYPQDIEDPTNRSAGTHGLVLDDATLGPRTVRRP